jgi:hypothetical protein
VTGFERVEFVDSVSATATIRLSLTTAPWRVLFAGTDVSPPPLKRVVAPTMLTDGTPIAASAYDNRVVTLRLQVDATDPVTAQTQIQVLRKELDRPTNVIRWQPEPTVPAVYFLTYRSPDTSDSIDHGINLHEFTVQIPAQPFAYGLKTDLSAAVVSNDPNAANGRFFDITGVKGDVETPLRLTIPSSVVSRQSLFAMRRRGTPSAAPFLVQAESMTQGTDTTVTVATDSAGGGASPSGAASNSSATTFATNTFVVPRLTATVPASPSVDARGTYRVFARVRCLSVANFRMRITHGARQINNTLKTYTLPTNIYTMVDLGLVQIPEGVDPVTDGPGGANLSVVGVSVVVHADRLTGANPLIWDYLLFVPADDAMFIIKWGDTAPTTFVIDGTSKTVYGIDGSGRIADIDSVDYVGLGWPTVSPGVTNRLYYINDVQPSPLSTDIVSSTVTINGSYWPRYLAVGTGA